VFILIQFLLRLSFGLAVGMLVTPSRLVTSGFYRNHLYVLLGLNVLASLAAFTQPARYFWVLPVLAAILSYAGSVIWLYEKRQAGTIVLALIAIASISGAWWSMSMAVKPMPEMPKAPVTFTSDPDDPDLTETEDPSSAADAWLLRALDPLTSGLLLGLTLAAMFLGHWYLNTPTMVLAPLERLIGLMALAILARVLVCGAGLALESGHLTSAGLQPVIFVSLRWLSGLAGAALLTGMAWQTLKIPNTQSATGILYAAVIVTFLGELVSLLMSQGRLYPL